MKRGKDWADRIAEKIPYRICPHQKSLREYMGKSYRPCCCEKCGIADIAKALRSIDKRVFKLIDLAEMYLANNAPLSALDVVRKALKLRRSQ